MKENERNWWTKKKIKLIGPYLLILLLCTRYHPNVFFQMYEISECNKGNEISPIYYHCSIPFLFTATRGVCHSRHPGEIKGPGGSTRSSAAHSYDCFKEHSHGSTGANHYYRDSSRLITREHRYSEAFDKSEEEFLTKKWSQFYRYCHFSYGNITCSMLCDARCWLVKWTREITL